jgi:hypothetical protein
MYNALFSHDDEDETVADDDTEFNNNALDDLEKSV